MPDSAEKRSSKRMRTLLTAQIVFNDRFSLIECTVRDLSESGAQLAFGHTIELPSEFQLEIPKKQMCVWARRMWSNGRNHGVMFFEPGVTDDIALGEDAAAELQKIVQQARMKISKAAAVPLDHVVLTVDLRGSQLVA